MEKEYCVWKEEEDGAYWSTTCGDQFTLYEGTPSANHMNFCPFCGKPLEEELITKPKL